MTEAGVAHLAQRHAAPRQTNLDNHTSAYCHCGYKLVAGPARHFLAEMEAVREIIAARWRRYSQERMGEPEVKALCQAMMALDLLIDMERTADRRMP